MDTRYGFLPRPSPPPTMWNIDSPAILKMVGAECSLGCPRWRFGDDGWIPWLVVSLGTAGHSFKCFKHHVGRLDHLGDPHSVSIVAIRAFDGRPLNGWSPIKFGIYRIWVSPSYVVIDPGCPDIGASDSVVHHFFCFCISNSLCSNEEYCALVKE